MSLLVVFRPQVVVVIVDGFVDAFLVHRLCMHRLKALGICRSDKAGDNVRPVHGEVAPAATRQRRLLHTRWHETAARKKREVRTRGGGAAVSGCRSQMLARAAYHPSQTTELNNESFELTREPLP